MILGRHNADATRIVHAYGMVNNHQWTDGQRVMGLRQIATSFLAVSEWKRTSSSAQGLAKMLLEQGVTASFRRDELPRGIG